MSEQFYTILTKIGQAKIANSGVLGIKVNFVKFKVGDGGGSYYSPTEVQTDVKNKVWEGNISAISVDESNPNWIVIETVIPTLDGGFTIREAGIFDDENNLIAIGKYPETYKPVAAEGSSKDLLIRMILEVSNAENVNLKVDPTVILATKKDIQTLESKIQVINTQLSDMEKDRIYYCGTTSGTNTYAVTNSEITEYIDGLTVRVKIGTASTAASTLNINGLGAKTILDTLGNPIISGGLKSGLPYQLCYNGTNFIVLGKGGGGTADASKILAPYTATVDGGLVTGTIPSKAAATITPGTVNQTIAANQYISGIQTILGDPGLLAVNIAKDKNIFGVVGSFDPMEYKPGTSTVLYSTGTSESYVYGDMITDYYKVREAKSPRNGVVTVVFDGASGSSLVQAYFRVYVNGVARGVVHSNNSSSYVTFSDDITVVAGDLVQLYVFSSARANTKIWFRVFSIKTGTTVALFT